MKQLFRNQIFNVYTISTFFLIPVIVLICWIADTALISSWNLVYDTPSGPITYLQFLQSFGVVSFVSTNSFHGLTFVLPLLASLSIGYFFQIKRGLFSNAYLRVPSCGRFIWKQILVSLLISMIVFYLGFLLILGYALITRPIRTDMKEMHVLFGELGVDFWKTHPIIYLLLEGVIRFCYYPFSYGLMAIAISLYTEKIYFYLLLPVVYHLVTSQVLSIVAMESNLNWLRLFAPQVGMHTEAMAELAVPIYYPLLSMFPVLIFSIIMIQYWIRKRRLWE